MIIKSRYSKKVLFLYFLLFIPITVLYFFSYVIIDTNKENFFQYELVVFFLLYTWFPTGFLYMILQQYKVVSITNDKIVVSRFFGLIEQTYPFIEVRRADYLFGSHGILLQFSGGKQITLGAKEFENYYELTKAIASVVEADQNIKVKYYTKGLKIFTSIGGLLLLLFLINQSI